MPPHSGGNVDYFLPTFAPAEETLALRRRRRRLRIRGALKWTPLGTSRTRAESELGRARYQLRRLHVVAYYDYYKRHYYGRDRAAY